LKIYGEHYPSFDQDIVLYLSNIGTSLPDCGKYDEALKYQERVLAIHEKNDPYTYTDIVSSLMNIGYIN
jgi:tetratricopeptide (TPR) repeat protein